MIFLNKCNKAEHKIKIYFSKLFFNILALDFSILNIFKNYFIGNNFLLIIFAP